MNYEEFRKWLLRGVDRCPVLYANKVVEKPKEANVVRLNAPVEPPRDFKKAAGGEEDWDGFEG